MRRAEAVVLVGFALGVGLVVGCVGASDGGERPPASTTTTVAAPGGAREVLAAVEDSIVFVESELATGSGIVVDGGYVLTNAHVTDPLLAVDVTFGDGTTATDVPVAGTDLLGDLALVGPVPEAEDVPSLDIVGDVPERADEVFLVGYPGEIDDEPEVTISAGIVSRIRDDDEFDLRYIQTDAAIGGGQSGGALVDGRGRVLGMSGLGGFAESFALVLSGADVLDAWERIDDGSAVGYGGIPGDDTATEGTLVVDDELDQIELVYRAGPEPLRLSVDADRPLAVEAFRLDFEQAFGNQMAIDGYELTADDPEADDALDALPQPELVEEVDGELVFPFDEGALVSVLVIPDIDTTGEVRWSTDQPVVDVSDRDPVPELPTLERGRPVEGVIAAGELYDVFAVELAEDEAVDLRAVAPNAGDPWLTVVGPGESYFETEALTGLPLDDLFEVGTDDTYRAERAGRHLVVVESGDGLSMLYRLTVDDP